MVEAGMAKARARSRAKRALAKVALTSPMPSIVRTAVVEEARRAGLLDGDKSEQVSFQAPPALVEAAKRETGVDSLAELGILALAMLVRRDPAAEFMKRTRGRLGKDHKLEY
jgi:hypothetical protein